MKRRRRVGEPAKFVSIEQGAGGDDATSAIEIADESRRVDQRLLDGWMDARLRAALKELPAAYRTVLVMREIEGCASRGAPPARPR